MARPKKSWIATEDHDELSMVEVNPLEGEIPQETVEAAIVSVDKVDRDIEQLVADGAELDTDIDDLEAVADTVGDSVEEGGMDEVSAQIANVAAESLCSKWGVKRTGMIATEDFGLHNRLDNTKIAAESLDVAVEGLLDTFTGWAKEMGSKIAAKWTELTTFAGAMQKRVAKQRQRLGTVSEIPSGEIEVGSGLFYEGKPDLGRVVKNVAGMGQTITAQATEVKKIFGKAKGFTLADKSEDANRILTQEELEKGTNAISSAIYMTAVAITAPPALPFVAAGVLTGGVISAVLRNEVPKDAVNVKVMELGASHALVSYVHKAVPKAFSTVLYQETKKETVKMPSKADLEKAVSALEKFASELQRNVPNTLKAINGPERESLIQAIDSAKAAKKEAKGAEYESKADKKEAVGASGQAIKLARAALQNHGVVSKVTADVITKQSKALADYVDSVLRNSTAAK